METNNDCTTSMIYPNGRTIADYVYNTGLDDSISRVNVIAAAQAHPAAPRWKWVAADGVPSGAGNPVEESEIVHRRPWLPGKFPRTFETLALTDFARRMPPLVAVDRGC